MSDGGRPSRGGRKRAAEAAAAPEPARPPPRKSRRADADAEAGAAGAPVSSREGKERRADAAAPESAQGKRTRSSHAALASSAEVPAASAGQDSRGAKEGKDKKEAAGADSSKGESRAKSRRTEKQAETTAAPPAVSGELSHDGLHAAHSTCGPPSCSFTPRCNSCAHRGTCCAVAPLQLLCGLLELASRTCTFRNDWSGVLG